MKVKAGEPIILHHRKAEFFILYEPNKNFSTHLGAVNLPENLEFGQRIESTKGETFFVLKPNLKDLTMKVKRTTTIIYPKDAGLIIMELGISAGKVVGEVGSGSGAFTILLASIVGREGKVFSFERRKEFLENAKKNVERIGLAERVKFIHRDVAVEGFGVENLDALFIDVPEPWTIIPFVPLALKKGGYIGSLSPNIEQVQRTVKTMKENGFVRIKTVETFIREIMVREGMTRPRDRMIGHTAYLTFGALAGLITP